MSGQIVEGATANQRQTTEGDDPDAMSLIDPLIALAKHKKIVIGLPFLVAILAALYSLTLSDVYTGTTKILPPQNSAGSASILGQLSGLAGLAGAVGVKNPSDIYVAMLKSRTVADNLIDRFDLMKATDSTYRSQARDRLARVTRIIPGKDGIITIEVDDKGAKRAAELANAYVDELYKLTNVLAVTEASQRRLFFERQFAQAKDNLAKAETAARQALQEGGLVQVEGQSRAILETAARLRGQISVKEVQINAMQLFATPQNSGMATAQRELEALKQELAKLEGGATGKGVPDRAVNGRGMDSVRLLRNVKYYETIYELLAKQYEIAKLEESKNSSAVQVLDVAIEADSRSGPKRRKLVIISMLAAFFCAVVWVFAREAIANARRDPQVEARFRTLKRHLGWR